MFNWDLNTVNDNLRLIKYQNFDAIQINPIQPLKEDGKNLWWLSYQPCGFRIGNQYGSKEDLIDLCRNAKKYDLKIIGDVICNHTAGANDGSLNQSDKVDRVLMDNPRFWKEKKNITNWDDRNQVISLCMGLPGLNQANYDLQDITSSFLNEMIDCGVDGFRFDAAKNIALPNENCDFWPRVIYCLKKYGIFLYGELIFESEDRALEYTKYIKILTSACYNKIKKDNIINFVESHDSYYDFKYTTNMDSKTISSIYSVQTHIYPNTLYFVRPFDDEWKSSIVREANKVKIR